MKFYFLALEIIHLFHLYSNWLPVIISNGLFGCCDKFGLGFMKIHRNTLYDEGNGVFLLYKVEEGKREPANKSKSGVMTLILIKIR